MPTSPIDLKTVGLRNESLVIRRLRQHGQVSQMQLRKLAGLSSSTASYIIGRLREKGLIVEQIGQSNTRGAKPVLISINPSGRYVIGIEINPTDLLIGLFDFNCKPVESLRVPIGIDSSPAAISNLLEISIRGLLSKHNINEQILAGIGCTLSGSISREGIVELSSPLGWKGVPFKEMLQSRFKCPVSLHTTRVRLLAESTLSPELSSKNVLYINIGNGVGSHVVIDGHLVHGCDNRSGEIGHIVIDPDGPICGCGHRGCLETFISGPALAKKIVSELPGSGSCLCKNISESDLPKDVISKWGQAIKQGDKLAISIQEYVGEKLGRVAAIAINCYDPEIVMLAGYVGNACMDHLAEAIQKRIQTDVFDNNSRKIMIMPARAGEQAIILGTATAVLQDYVELNQ